MVFFALVAILLVLGLLDIQPLWTAAASRSPVCSPACAAGSA